MNTYLVRDVAAPPVTVSMEGVQSLLEAHKIAITDDVRAGLVQVVHDLQSSQENLPAEMLVAQGRRPEPGRDGELVWSDRCNPDRIHRRKGEEFSHYASRLVQVAQGERIAQLQPPSAGTEGIDVYGRTTAARAGAAASVVARKGCHLDEATGHVLADVSGTLDVHGREITVTEMLHVAGNVDFSTGHIEHAPHDVEIDGDIVDLFNVFSLGDVTVHGNVQSSRLCAAGNVQIDKALVNHRKGICLAGGSLKARLADNSVAAVRGDIHIEREAIASDLFAGGKIECPGGGICGGTIVAGQGLTTGVLGSGGAVRTLVVVGVNWELPARVALLAAEVAQCTAELDKRLPTLELLKANLRRLTAPQCEQVAQMERKLVELQARREQLKQEIEALRLQSEQAARAEVTVSSRIYPGTELRLGNFVTDISDELRGQATYHVAQILGEDTIIRTFSGGRDILPTRRIADPLMGIALPELPPEPQTQQ